MKPRDIFGLAVRLLGLYFLYSALNDFAQALGSDIFQSPEKMDIVYSLLPVFFKLVVSVWLLSGWPLIRLVYPEPKASESFSLPPKRPAASPTPSPEPVAPSQPADIDADKKLAALVEKPKDR